MVENVGVLNSEFAEDVANICYKTFDTLPKSGKPSSKNEWTLISAIVKKSDKGLQVVSLATGSKCIGHDKMNAEGTVINDSHAEVLSRRGFVRYLYHEIDNIKNGSRSAVFRYNNNTAKYVLIDGVTFHLFTSHIPCGDASIFPKYESTVPKNSKFNESVRFHISKKDRESDEYNTVELNVGENKKRNIWPEEQSAKIRKLSRYESLVTDNIGNVVLDIHRTGAKCLVDAEDKDPKLPGTDYHIIGVVRTKPGRGVPTLSVSCSDKIAKWNCVGIQGALLSLLIDPIYLSSIIIGCRKSMFSKESLYRAVIHRIEHITSRIPVPVLLHSDREFIFSRYQCDGYTKPSFTSIVWCNVPSNNHEVYVQGKKLGCTRQNAKQSLPFICKKTFINRFKALTGEEYRSLTYYEIKQKATEYQSMLITIKSALGGWSSKPENLSHFI